MKTKHLSIGFIPEMAVAALRAENPKTLTTRLSGLAAVNSEPDSWRLTHFDRASAAARLVNADGFTTALVSCRYAPGERRELLTRWAVPKCLDDLKPIRIDFAGVAFWHAGMGPKPEWAGKSRPGNFLPGDMRHLMPAVEITGVKLERMQAITEAQAVAEGFDPANGALGSDCISVGALAHAGLSWPAARFADTIARIHPAKKGKPNGWDANPWVWRIGFEVVSRGEAMS